MRPTNFSSIKRIAQSPAHYKYAIDNPEEFEPTRAMRLGTIAHHIVLGARAGRRLHVYEGERRGNAWNAFRVERAGEEIVTRAEYEEAKPIADAVLANPETAKRLVGKTEVTLSWYDGGIACATSGIDVIGDGWICDLKTTKSAHPARFPYQVADLSYHAQLAFYRRGCRANGIPCEAAYIVAVECTAPYLAVSFRLPPHVLEEGDRLITKWLERLRVCEDTGVWPGYTQTEVDLELPARGWESDEEDAA